MVRWLLLIGFSVLLWPGHVSAHRMDLACSVDGRDLLIETWTGGDEPVVDGEVTIKADDGTILATGKTDEKGIFRWMPNEYRTVTVTVYGGQGHQESITLRQEEMKSLFTPVDRSPSSIQKIGDHSHPVRPSQSPKRISTQNTFGTPERVILGLTLILAAMAAWMSYRNSQKLSALDAWVRNRESRD